MMHQVAATFTTIQHSLRARLMNSERGASALEYVGMILVAAVVVGAVAGALSSDAISGAIDPKIDDILNIGGGGGGGEGSGT